VFWAIYEINIKCFIYKYLQYIHCNTHTQNTIPLLRAGPAELRALLRGECQINRFLHDGVLFTSFKGISNNSFASKFSEFFIDNENFCSTIGIMQKNLKNFGCTRHSSSQWLGSALICTKFEAVYEKPP